MSLVHNERIKLAATALNNLGVATLATGIVAPAIGFLYGTANPETHGWWLLIGVAWLLAGAALHFMAQIVLGRLRP